MRQDVKQKAKRREIYNEIKELRRELRQREVRRMSSVCPPNRTLVLITVGGMTTFPHRVARRMQRCKMFCDPPKWFCAP